MNKFNRSLTIGSYGLDVLNLQSLLEKFGFGDFIPTGYFGKKTQEAVIKFQAINQISPSYGFFGEKTRAYLNSIISNNREILYHTARGCLKTDASPNDVAPDEYGCAETVNAVHSKAFGYEIGGNISTYRMYEALTKSPFFIRVDQPDRGDIIISPTGYGNGNLTNGHVGIMASSTDIMSNDSYTGKFEKNFTLKSWRDRYSKVGGYPVVFFRRV